MTKEEAIKAMQNGKKVTHRYFTSTEWVKSNQSGTTYILEDGVECSPQEFWMWRKGIEWETDWELFLTEEEKERLKVLMETMDVIKSGYAGILPNGNIVDRREHPEAVPCPENPLFLTPKPKEL